MNTVNRTFKCSFRAGGSVLGSVVLVACGGGNTEKSTSQPVGASGTPAAVGIGATGVPAPLPVTGSGGAGFPGMPASAGTAAGGAAAPIPGGAGAPGAGGKVAGAGGAGAAAPIPGGAGAPGTGGMAAGEAGAPGMPAAPVTCELERFGQKVFYGTLEPTLVALAEDSIVAIGQLTLNGLCSGTLINREWVLTAQHCTDGVQASQMRFRIGRDPENPDMAYDVAEKRENPDGFDTTLLRLTKSPLDDDPKIVPIPVGLESLDDTKGDMMEAAGYGRTENGSQGTRYFTAEPVVDLSQRFISVDGEGARGLCGGDSGGPLMTTYEDGTVRVVGDLTRGAESCVGVDQFTRLDNQADWITSVVGEVDPCAGLTSEGSCDGQTARWCEDETPNSEDCMAMDRVCGEDMAGNNRCIEDTSCGELTAAGECEGQIATWCENETRQTQDCSAVAGQICGVDATAMGSRCIADPCQGVSELGDCQGTTARACIDGALATVDCAVCGQQCDVNAALGAGCVPL